METVNKKKRGNFKRLVLADLNTSEGLGTESPTEGFEFSLISFKDIATATSNFHRSYMIGQGGFGKVYKWKSSIFLF